MTIDPGVLLQYALKVLLALGVFLFGRWLAGRVRKSLNKGMSKSKISPSMARLLILAAYYVILAVTIIVALAIVGFPIQALLTASLVVVVILGLALQSSISNLAATIMFMLFDPFHAGELVETNGVTGTVDEIQFFSTVLLTADNKQVTIPNGKIQGDKLVNYSRLGLLRADMTFSVSYADDMGKAIDALQQILAADARVLAEPAPMVFVLKLDDSSINIAAWAWVKEADYFQLQWDLPRRVKDRFDELGISIPFPQQDVHIYRQGADGALAAATSQA